MSDTQGSSKEPVIYQDDGWRECADCGHRWLGGHNHCCDCAQSQIERLRLIIKGKTFVTDAAPEPLVLPQEVPAAHRAGTEPLSRLAGDIDYSLAKINPEHDVHGILYRAREALRDLCSPQPPASEPCAMQRELVAARVILEQIEAHCVNGRGLIGIDHAEEGRRIRAGLQAFLATPSTAQPPPPALFNCMREWIEHAPHGDNCFVSDHYEGDPGNQCHCGKDSLIAAMNDRETQTSADDPIPAFIVRHVERAIEDALYPSGMSTHDGKARFEISAIWRLMALARRAAQPPGAECPHYPCLATVCPACGTIDFSVKRGRRIAPKVCQHDRFKPDPTLVPLGSAALGSSNWVWQCSVCIERFEFPLPTAYSTATKEVGP